MRAPMSQQYDEQIAVKDVVEVSVLLWRLARLTERVASRLDPNEQVRFLGQVRFILSQNEDRLAAKGLSLVSIEGHPFEPGMAAEARNLEEFDPDEPLVVDQVLEPVVVGPHGLVREGVVLLRREK